jgi:hypothetical protein
VRCALPRRWGWWLSVPCADCVEWQCGSLPTMAGWESPGPAARASLARPCVFGRATPLRGAASRQPCARGPGARSPGRHREACGRAESARWAAAASAPAPGRREVSGTGGVGRSGGLQPFSARSLGPVGRSCAGVPAVAPSSRGGCGAQGLEEGWGKHLGIHASGASR